MTTQVFRFKFADPFIAAEAELTLHLATYAVEGLFGSSQVRMEVEYELDRASDAIVIAAGTEVGAALTKVFTSLLLREFGEDAFVVRGAESIVMSDGKAA